MRVFIDSFSGSVADLAPDRRNRPKQRTPEKVLAVLRRDPMVSTFDMSEHPWLCDCIETLKRDGRIVEDESTRYPWHRFNVVGSN